MNERASTSQRGSILLLALFFAGTIASLTFAMICWVQVGVRGYENAAESLRAEAAAISGVELAATRALRDGDLLDQQLLWNLGSEQSVTLSVSSSATPNVRSIGASRGIEVALEAQLDLLGGELNNALASFCETNHFHYLATIQGPVYLGDPIDPIHRQPKLTIYDGDLEVLDTSQVDPKDLAFPTWGGVKAVQAYPAPTWDTSAFEFLASDGTTTVHHYYGDTVLDKQTLDGILVFHPVPYGTIEFVECTIQGTIVVLCDYANQPPADPLSCKLIFSGATTLTGGTARTGDLAVLAPGCDWSASSPNPFQASGVIFVGRVSKLKETTITGNLWSRGSITFSSGVQIVRPADWVPDVPMGLEIPRIAPPTDVRIRWMAP